MKASPTWLLQNPRKYIFVVDKLFKTQKKRNKRTISVESAISANSFPWFSNHQSNVLYISERLYSYCGALTVLWCGATCDVETWMGFASLTVLLQRGEIPAIRICLRAPNFGQLPIQGQKCF